MVSSQLRRGLSIMVYRIFVLNICHDNSTNFQMPVFSRQMEWSLTLIIFWVETPNVQNTVVKQAFHN